MTDIKIKRYADKENLKELMRYCKATFASKDGSIPGGTPSGDYYTKSEIDTKLNSKANKTTTLSGYGITDAYTKTQVDKKVSDLVNSAPETLDTLNELASALGNDSNFATTIATQIGNKANSSDVYNKSEIDDLLSHKTNDSDLATVATTGSYNDLLDKPTSFDVDLSNYYTKSEIDNLRGSISINSITNEEIEEICVL